MNNLDLHTVYFSASMLYVLMPLVVWVALREQKSPTVTMWCVGGEVLGVAVLLQGLRHQLPELLTHELANFAVITAGTLRVQALSMELGKPLSRGTLTAIPLGFLALHAGSRWLLPNDIFDAVLTLALLAALLAWLARLAHELAERDDSTSARTLEAIYWVFVILVLLRAFEVTAGGSAKTLSNGSLIATGMNVMGVISAVLGNASFLGIFVERSVRERLLAVAERVRREESDRLGRQIAHLDRQRTLGMLSSSLHHELRQPMTNMQLLASRAEQEAAEAGESESAHGLFVQGILRNLRYATAIIDRARGFAKSESVEYRLLTLQEVNANVMALLADWLRHEAVDVRVSLPEQPVRIRGDLVQLSQILVNLYRNAVQACAGQAERILAVTMARNEEYGSIRIQDNGPGFSGESLDQAGTPFFTTKADGVGIGLSIVRNIIEKHRGELKLSNGETGGALVEIRLPLA